MGMNPTLAAMYNTHGAGQALQEEQVKVAHLDLFAKAAMANGIDLSQLDDETKNELFAEFTTKLAEEDGGEEGGDDEEKEEGGNGGPPVPPPPPKKEEGKSEGKSESDEEEEKEAAARREHEARVEWQEKNAQADFLGRRMAHAFWNEYNEISKQAAAEASKVATGGAPAPASAPAAPTKKKLAGAPEAAPKQASAQISPFDHQAAEEALKIASAGGWDEQECIQRLNSVLTLGPKETEKTAGIRDYSDSVSVRGLELLEQAGYAVDWNQVFNK